MSPAKTCTEKPRSRHALITKTILLILPIIPLLKLDPWDDESKWTSKYGNSGCSRTPVNDVHLDQARLTSHSWNWLVLQYLFYCTDELVQKLTKRYFKIRLTCWRCGTTFQVCIYPMMRINYGFVENKAGDQEDNYAGRINFKRKRTHTQDSQYNGKAIWKQKTGGEWSTLEDREDSAKPVDGDRSQWGTRQASQCPRRRPAGCWLH